MAIRHKRTSTTGYNWQSGDLALGQLGINTADGTLHLKKGDNTVIAVNSTVDFTGTLDFREGIQLAPLDSNGRALFIAAGTGRNAIATGITTSAPLVLAHTLPYTSEGKPADLITRITSNTGITWGQLATNSTSYLFIEDDGNGVLTFPFSTLEPSFGHTRPTSPATGQWHYDTRHLGPPEVWNGSAWVAVNRIPVGEAVTGASSVTAARSYAVKGEYISPLIPGTQNREDVLSHNIGVPGILIEGRAFAIVATANNNYVAGDILPFPFGTNLAWSDPGTNSRGNIDTLEGTNILRVRQVNVSNFAILNKTSGSNSSVLPTRSDFDFRYILKRGF